MNNARYLHCNVFDQFHRSVIYVNYVSLANHITLNAFTIICTY